jgi:hypothetical protein
MDAPFLFYPLMLYHTTNLLFLHVHFQIEKLLTAKKRTEESEIWTCEITSHIS